MSVRLSHSASSRFQNCPQDYKYWYIDRYRPITQSAALLFGSAVDAAITTLLVSKEKSPEAIFAFMWRFQDLNGERIYLPTSVNIVYSDSDWDKDLLVDEDWKTISEKFEVADPQEHIKSLYALKKEVGFKGLSYDQKQVLNFANWHCLYRKGLLMIDAVRKKILPQIKEVLGVQVYVKLKNSEDDMIVGYADLVCKWKDDRIIIFDFKTSSRTYEEDSVLTSPQLSLYLHGLSSQYNNTRFAGYIVLNKRVDKNKTKKCSKCQFDGTGMRHKTCPNEIEARRCDGDWIEVIDPEVFIQTIISEIPSRTEDIVIENMDNVNTAIKHNNFPRNFNSCHTRWGTLCPFFNKCFRDSNEGLIQLEAKKD
jgi:hypothetical protein